MREAGSEPAGRRVPGTIRQRQKGLVALRLHAVGGDFDVDQMQAIAGVAERFGGGMLHLSTRQGIEIHDVPEADAGAAVRELEAAGVTMGASGSRVRIITACPGTSSCRWGIIDTKAIARDLDRAYFGAEAPYKFKIAVTGCPNNCAKATENDIGIMGAIVPAWNADACTDCGACARLCPGSAIEKTGDRYVVDTARCLNCSRCTASCPEGAWTALRRGVILWIGGTMGKAPRLATRTGGVIETGDALDLLVARSFAYYRENGRPKERFGHLMDRIGVEAVMQEIAGS